MLVLHERTYAHTFHKARLPLSSMWVVTQHDLYSSTLMPHSFVLVLQHISRVINRVQGMKSVLRPVDLGVGACVAQAPIATPTISSSTLPSLSTLRIIFCTAVRATSIDGTGPSSKTSSEMREKTGGGARCAQIICKMCKHTRCV